MPHTPVAKRLATAITTALLFSSLGGCASVANSRVRTDRRVVTSAPVELDLVGKLVVRDAAWKGSQFEAQIGRQKLCQSAIRQQVEYQRVQEHVTRNVATSIVLGGLATAGGGTLLGLAPSFSDDPGTAKDGSSTVSNRTSAYASGALLALAGGIYLIHGIVQGARGADEKLGRPRLEEEDKPQGDPRVCGERPALPGRLGVRFDEGAMVADAAWEGGTEARLDTTPWEPSLCGDEARIGHALRVVYVQGKSKPVELGQRSLDDCIRSRVAGRLLDEAAPLLAGEPQPAQFARADELTRRAAALVADLTPGHPEAARLGGRIEAQHAAVAEAGVRILEGTLSRYARSLAERGPARSIGPAMDVRRVSRGVPGREVDAWRRVYTTFARAAADQRPMAVAALGELLRRDDPTRGCLADKAACLPGMGAAELAEAIVPLTTRVRSAISAHRATLARTGKAFGKKVDEANFAALDRALREAQGDSESLCGTPGWSPEVAADCQELGAELGQSRTGLESGRAQLSRLRITRTARSWRQIFPQCQQLSAGLRQTQSLSSCGRECQQVIAQMQSRQRALAAFTVVDGELDEATRAVLRVECQTAGCPVCP